MTPHAWILPSVSFLLLGRPVNAWSQELPDCPYRLVGQWGSGGIGPGQFAYPGGIAVDATGRVFVGDWSQPEIEVFTSDGEYLETWRPAVQAHDIEIDSEGNVFALSFKILFDSGLPSDARVDVFDVVARGTCASRDSPCKPPEPEISAGQQRVASRRWPKAEG